MRQKQTEGATKGTVEDLLRLSGPTSPKQLVMRGKYLKPLLSSSHSSNKDKHLLAKSMSKEELVHVLQTYSKRASAAGKTSLAFAKGNYRPVRKAGL